MRTLLAGMLLSTVGLYSQPRHPVHRKPAAHFVYVECAPHWHYHPRGFRYDGGMIGDGQCHQNIKDILAYDPTNTPKPAAPEKH